MHTAIGPFPANYTPYQLLFSWLSGASFGIAQTVGAASGESRSRIEVHGFRQHLPTAEWRVFGIEPVFSGQS
jgi:hypothetical protein